MVTPLSLIKPLWVYLKESRVEMRKVNWPSRKDLVRLTAAEINASAFVSAILGGADYAFNRIVITALTKFKQ